jgi:signal transduction histidine kinase
MGRSLLFSLRSRLILLVLIAVLPGFFLTLFVANLQRQIALREVKAQSLSTLRLAALSQSQLIANTETLFATLAEASEIRSHSVQGCNALLDRVFHTSVGYRGFSVNTMAGKSWCLTANLRAAISNSIPVTNTVNPNAELYERALAKGGFVVGNFVIGNITKRPNFNFAQPIYDDHRNAIAMLVGSLDLDQLNKSIGELQLPEGYVVDMLDRDGTFVVRWPDPADYVGKTFADKPITQKILTEGRNGNEFVGEMEGVEGMSRLYAFKRVPGMPDNDLFINVGIAPELAYADINAALRQNLIVLGMFTLLALIGAWVISDLIVLRPISAIARTAKEISKGNLSARTQLKYGHGELSLLARDFDDMCGDLQKRSDELEVLNTNLEQKVQIRTDQLQTAVNKLRLSREQLRHLSHQQRAVLEEEQTRIAREVHDQIGQALTGLKMDLSTLQRRVLAESGAPKPAVTSKIKEMANLIDDTIQTTRAIARRLRPTILDDLGLGAAIEWQAGDFQQRTGVVCTFINHNVTEGLDREVATAAYRIVQEALTNVTRHAQATEVLIELEIAEQTLKVQVRDNGKGVAAEQLENLKSLGVLGMRERARELGGTIDIQNANGKGVLVFACLPTQPFQSVTARQAETANGNL